MKSSRQSLLVFVALVLAAATGLRGQTDGTVKWTFAMQGVVYSSPAVAQDGTIYVGSQGRRLWAVNPDGSFKWRFPNTLVSTADWFDAAPVIAADGTIYAANFDGRLFALNPDGTLKWTYVTQSYIISSPAIGLDGTIHVGAGDGALHAINPDGTPRWSFQTGDWVDSSPAIAADGTIYFGSWDNTIYAVRPDGSLRWSVSTGDAIQSSPAIGPDGTVYIGSADRNLYAVSPDGLVEWTFHTGDSVDASPVVGPDGTIYFGSADGYFYALRPDGAPAWAAPFDAGQGIFGSALIRADGTLLFGASDRSLYAVNADGTLKWKLVTGDVIDSSPAMAADGTIYVGSYDGKLYALHGSGAAVASSSWPKFRADARQLGRVLTTALSGPPVISVQPTFKTAPYGEEVTFSVQAVGLQPLSFQWQKDGVDIVGATQSSYTVAQVDAAAAGVYRVVVSNALGSVSSADALLAVESPIAPVITVQPRPLVVAPGQRVSLWVIATGSAPLAYQWFKDGAAVAGANGRFFEVNAASAADAGSYTVEVSNAGGPVASTPASVAIDAAAASRLVNLSTRGYVGTGDSILIPGFVLVGTGQRRVLIRAVGPTLASLGVSDVIANPELTLVPAAGSLISNDDWGTSANVDEIRDAFATLGAFTLPDASLDAALLVDLAPGAYTLHVSGVAGDTGNALVELYDAGAVGADDSRLVNISTRGFTGTGAEVMIPGFVINGTGARTLLIRAVGPTLSLLGVSDFAADPVLTVFAGSAPILAVDDWSEASDVAALLAASGTVGAFALEANSADAAVLLVLMPGIYTAQAAGDSGTTGNVLVEVYEVP